MSFESLPDTSEVKDKEVTREHPPAPEIPAHITRTEAGGITLEVPAEHLTARAVHFEQRSPEGNVDSELPASLELGGKTWLRKNEFHVTWVGFGSGLEKALKVKRPELSNKQARDEMRGLLDQSLTTLPSLETAIIPTGELRRIKKGENESVIAMCELNPAGAAAFEHLKQSIQDQFGVAIEMPPAHITLYTLENGQAIGITTEQQLTDLTAEKLEL